VTEPSGRMKIIAFCEKNAIESFINGVARAPFFFLSPMYFLDASVIIHRIYREPRYRGWELSYIAVLFPPCPPLVLFRQRSVTPVDKQFCITFVYTAVARVLSTGNCNVTINLLPLSNDGSFVHCILIPIVSLNCDCN